MKLFLLISQSAIKRAENFSVDHLKKDKNTHISPMLGMNDKKHANIQ